MCKRRFVSSKRNKKTKEDIYFDYVFGKQVLRELARDTYLTEGSIVYIRDTVQLPQKIHNPRVIYAVADATYFGQRALGTSWGFLVFRDTLTSEDLWWKPIHKRETMEDYLEGKLALEQLGYIFGSITVDGFPGLQGVFHGIPFQYCQIHMERTCVSYLTRKPKTTPGKALLSLVYSLKEMSRAHFQQNLQDYITQYQIYLNQKTHHKSSGKWSYTHKRVRGCLHSLVKNLNALFTFQSDKNIDKDTNSIEGHFSHIKDILKVHRGLSKDHKIKALEAIMLSSTIAPKERKLGG